MRRSRASSGATRSFRGLWLLAIPVKFVDVEEALQI